MDSLYFALKQILCKSVVFLTILTHSEKSRLFVYLIVVHKMFQPPLACSNYYQILNMHQK